MKPNKKGMRKSQSPQNFGVGIHFFVFRRGWKKCNENQLQE